MFELARLKGGRPLLHVCLALLEDNGLLVSAGCVARWTRCLSENHNSDKLFHVILGKAPGSPSLCGPSHSMLAHSPINLLLPPAPSPSLPCALCDVLCCRTAGCWSGLWLSATLGVWRACMCPTPTTTTPTQQT